MAISINNGNGSSGRRRSYGAAALAEINVTPFVDVVLVLLIIFMITAHVMEVGFQVDVPKTRYVKDSARELPVIHMTRDGELYLNDKEINIYQISSVVKNRFPGQAVYLRADRGATWDMVAQVMSALADAGIQINAVTQPEDSADKRKR
ncbi:MAG: biopolymer transporter ExbD [Acidobacteriia bacterium]|nr:biopolymer transporter ExbD [Terriglobia bacterium]